MSDKVKVAVVGASGYTGAEAMRVLINHPLAEIVALTADRKAGMGIGEVYSHLEGFGLPNMVSLADVDWSEIDVAFCCLPHGTSQEVIRDLPRHLKIIDLSADFRFADVETYAGLYGHEHYAPELQPEAAYGLTEIYKEKIAKARLVACPGCYPTSAQLPLIPLVESGKILTEDIIIDAKTGVSGAGRAAKEAMLFAEVAEGLHAYGVATHRHGPEIEQGLGWASGKDVTVNFTPHLAPMNRGILASIYVKMAEGQTADSLRETLQSYYADAPFVRVADAGVSPKTRDVRGSNLCVMSVFEDRIPGRAIVLSAIDNLTKGSSGQAVQNMNVMMGLEETLGLNLVPLFP